MHAPTLSEHGKGIFEKPWVLEKGHLSLILTNPNDIKIAIHREIRQPNCFRRQGIDRRIETSECRYVYVKLIVNALAGKTNGLSRLDQ